MNSGTSRPVRILLIGERRCEVAALESAAGHLGYAVVRADPEVAALTAVARDSFDAAIVAVGTDRERSLDVIGELAAGAPCPVIALLDVDDREFLREAAGRGVFAYITGDDVGGDRFQNTIDIALHRYAEYHGRDRGHAKRIAVLERAEEIAGIGSYAWDIQSGGLWWSDNVFRLFGLRPGVALTAEYVVDFVHADDREHVREVVETAAWTGELGMFEYRIRRADGALRRLQAVVAAVEQTDGLPGRLVGTVQDVTERRQNARMTGPIALEELAPLFDRRAGDLRPNDLTRREREVLQFAAQGMSGKAIALELTLSSSTVKTHFENIYAKWDVSDRASAVAKALREGVIL